MSVMEDNKVDKQLVSCLLTPGTICIANRDSSTDNSEGLSFHKGDVLIILNCTSTECTIQSVEGTVGRMPLSTIVHRSPIPLSPMTWFHYCGSREEAEELLDVSIEGQFLVRPSQTSDSVYGLAVSSSGSIQHYLVANSIKNDNQLTIDGHTFHTTLPELIKYYENGHTPLPSLTHPLISRDVLKYYVDKYSLKQFWGLQSNDITILKTVGKGEFGEVHAGKYRKYEVAIKSIPESKEDGPTMQGFLQEAAILTHLRHKNLVQMVGVVFEGLTLKQIVLEFMSKGSVSKYLSSRGRSVVAQSELLSISRDICEGMVYISSQGFVHRDLAARNVLLNLNGQAKISDFGLARKIEAHVPHEEGKFPVKWTAPEGITQKLFSEKSDIWSFGICLWEIYSFGRVPYPSILAEDVLEQLEDGYLMDPPDNCPHGIYAIMTQCWTYEPDNRPTFESLKVMLSQSFGESRTPCSSPSPSRRTMVDFTEKVGELLLGPIASKIYLEAPMKQSTTLYLANLLLIGQKGAGKTSLLRCFQGNQFRQREQPTTTFDLSSEHCELVIHRAWLPSPNGLFYNNELTRVIISSLLKEPTCSSIFHTEATPPPPSLPPTRQRPASVHLEVPPPLPTRPRPQTQRMSMLLESTHASDPNFKLTGSHPEGLNLSPPTSPKSKRAGLKRRFSLTKLFKKPSNSNIHRRSNSVNHKLHPSSSSPPSSSPTLPPRSITAPSLLSGELDFISAIPDSLIPLLKEKLRDCMSGSLPPEIYGRLIDVPSTLGTQPFKSLLLTETTIIIAVFNTTLNDPLPGLLAELDFAFSSTPPTLTSIVLVGTHSDCHASHSVAKQRLDLVRRCLKETRYGQFLVSGSFIVSCSSAFDQALIEDVKKYIMDLVRSRYHFETPLRWLRCVKRFQSFSASGQYMLPLLEAEAIVKEVCLVKDKDEIHKILQFLHNHLVIIFNPSVLHTSTVYTNPCWLLETVSKLLSLRETITTDFPLSLQSDHQSLLTKGLLTDNLLDHLCPLASRTAKQALLSLLNLFELIGIISGPATPARPPSRQSEKSSSLSPFTTPSSTPTSSLSMITSVLVPSVVQEELKDQLLPPLLEPMYYMCTGSQIEFNLPLIFLRLLLRCYQTHHTNCLLFKNAGCFLINAHTRLLVQRHCDSISVSLHPSTLVSSPPPSSSSPPLSLSHNTADVPSIETVLTVAMFMKPTLTDICQTWTRTTAKITFKQAFKCGHCLSSAPHYIIIPDDNDDVLDFRQKYKCQLGNLVTLPSTAGPWFGEEVGVVSSFSSLQISIDSLQEEEEDNADSDKDDEYVNSNDIDLITQALQSSWAILGDAIGASTSELELLRNAPEEQTGEMFKELCSNHLRSLSFLDLVSNLEDIGHSDVANSLIDLRMKTSGIAL